MQKKSLAKSLSLMGTILGLCTFNLRADCPQLDPQSFLQQVYKAKYIDHIDRYQFKYDNHHWYIETSIYNFLTNKRGKTNSVAINALISTGNETTHGKLRCYYTADYTLVYNETDGKENFRISRDIKH